MVAVDSFKGSLTSVDVAAAIMNGWLDERPGDLVTGVPLADGGEGTLEAIEAAVHGSMRRDAGPVRGPDGRTVQGEWLYLPGDTAVVELAQMSGLPLMAAPDATGATTYGLGEVIVAALDAGATSFVIGLGGSASTDAGAGALAALGLRATGGRLDAGGAELGSITALDIDGMVPPPPAGVVLLTDVSSPLLGEHGAAAVFGPQKGADPSQVASLDAALGNFARLLGGDPEAPGAGAAGGTGYGFSAAWEAEIQPGAQYLLHLTGVASAVAQADVVITGEGRFDATSFQGKLVGELIHFAAGGTARIGVIAGAVSATPVTPDGQEIWSASLTDLAGSTDAAMAEPRRWLRQAGAAAARALGTGAAQAR